MDRDGDVDVLWATGGRIAWQENAAGAFSATRPVTETHGADRGHAADLDGDGDLDVLLGQSGKGIAWYENRGDGEFAGRFMPWYFASEIDAVDLGGDGSMDVLISGAGRISWYENQGDGAFPVRRAVTEGDFRRDRWGPIGTGDVDGDGDIDVLGYSYSSSNAGGSRDPRMAWHVNHGDGMFSEWTFAEFQARLIVGLPDDEARFHAVDMDGDGDLDVLSGVRELAWYENGGAPPPSFSPVDIRVHAVGTALVVRWEPPGDATGFDGFVVVAIPHRGERVSCTASAEERVCTIEGLMESTNYSVLVYATNDGGRGPTVSVSTTTANEVPFEMVAPFFPAASDPHRQGFVRVVNLSQESDTVRIEAVDDAGQRRDPIDVEIPGRGTVHLNSVDLESGAPGKGLAAGVGPAPVGSARRLDAAHVRDVVVLVYMRTSDGFLTSMHDWVREGPEGHHHVAIFNPGSNVDQRSLLRLANTGEQPAEVSIEGTDDAGASPGGAVMLTLPAGTSRSLSAEELETGVAPGLANALGDGEGKWRWTVASEEPIEVMSLLSSPTGHLTNLSTVPGDQRTTDDGSTVHLVPLFPAASDALGRQGFVRVINRDDALAEVAVAAFDETDRHYDPLTLTVGASAVVHFNSDDIELGNADKGLGGSTGAGEGDWWLELTSGADIQVLSYVRTNDGFLTSMHDVAPMSHRRAHKASQSSTLLRRRSTSNAQWSTVRSSAQPNGTFQLAQRIMSILAESSDTQWSLLCVFRHPHGSRDPILPGRSVDLLAEPITRTSAKNPRGQLPVARGFFQSLRESPKWWD